MTALTSVNYMFRVLNYEACLSKIIGILQKTIYQNHPTLISFGVMKYKSLPSS